MIERGQDGLSKEGRLSRDLKEKKEQMCVDFHIQPRSAH
jgi:hypothetical protein